MIPKKRGQQVDADKLTKWACPECGAPYDDHGKGECRQAGGGMCSGMICDCDGDTDNPEHGTTQEPCPTAHCYHCGWEGEFPTGMVQCPTCKGAGKVKEKAKRKSKI